jgi:hypothetical protein
MLANHDQFTQEMCDRLKTTCMGLGLVRLLQDAKRFDEARAELVWLENGFQCGAVEIPNDSAFCQSPFVVGAESSASVSVSTHA